MNLKPQDYRSSDQTVLNLAHIELNMEDNAPYVDQRLNAELTSVIRRVLEH